MKFLLSFAFAMGVFCCGYSQNPTYYKTGTGTSGNTIPWNQASQKTQLLYAPGDFNTLPIPGYITKLYFRNAVAAATGTFTNLQISFLQTTDTSFPATSFYTGVTPALTSSSFVVTGNAIAGGWYEIQMPTPYFVYDNTKSLVVEIQYTAKVGGLNNTTSTSIGNKRCSGTSLTATTGTTNTTQNDFGMDVSSNLPCTSPPTPGVATASVPVLCPGSSVALNLTGSSSGIGQTYYWQSATSPGGPYTNIGTSSSNYYLTVTPTATAYYRCAVTCSGITSYSTPVQVLVPGAFAGGTYTINSAQPTSGTNFNSFTDAVNYMFCGITGPVVFNVVPGSGPYNEQVSIPQINGTSATNTITFNGNGATLSFTNNNAVNYGILRLDGADYIRIKKLNITAGASGSYGIGVLLTNDADNNLIDSCTVNVSATSTSATATSGIVMTSSSVDAAAAGSLCDNNIISNNNINGGYCGIILYGSSTTVLISGNQVINNTVKDFYAYGIWGYYTSGLQITGNDISRPTRTTVTTTNGIRSYYGDNGLTIANNKIHSLFTNILSSTSAAYGLYLYYSDGTSSAPNAVYNNILYDFNGDGAHYGIYSSNCLYTNIDYNTIAFDNTASATTSLTYGINHLTATTGANYRNNIVMITRGGSGVKYGFYRSSGSFTSNYNDLYVNSSGGSNNIGYYTSAQNPISSWQSASGGDANSLTTDPLFINSTTGNLAPQAAALNNQGTPIPGIATDITGATRATTPDIGAFEFIPPTCPPSSGLAAGSITSTSASLSWTSSATLWQIEYAANVSSFAQGSGDSIIIASSNPYSLAGLTPGTAYAVYLRNVCSVGDTSMRVGPVVFITAFPTTLPNDSCGNATDISNGLLYAGTTVNATESMAPCNSNTTADDVWYKFTTANAAGSVTINVNTGTTGTDVVIQGLSGSCSSTMTPLTPTSSTTLGTSGCIDGPAAGLEFGTFAVATNTTYYIRVYTFTGTTPGAFTIQVAGTPLAILLGNITATNNGISNLIDWNTLTEDKGDKFELQRSADGKAFEPIKSINANGIPGSRYSHIDNAPFAGINYYRLLLTHNSGKPEYSPTVKATVAMKSGFRVNVFPNPVSNVMNVSVMGRQSGIAHLRIIDIAGRLIKTVIMSSSQTEIDMSGLIDGVYLIQYIDDTHTQTMRVNKQ